VGLPLIVRGWMRLTRSRRSRAGSADARARIQGKQGKAVPDFLAPWPGRLNGLLAVLAFDLAREGCGTFRLAVDHRAKFCGFFANQAGLTISVGGRAVSSG
jgi:hypothetical protein